MHFFSGKMIQDLLIKQQSKGAFWRDKRALVIFIIFYIAVFYLWIIYWQDNKWIKILGSDLLAFGSLLVTIASLYRTYKNSETDKIFWLLLLLGFVSYACAELIAGYYELILRVNSPSPGYSDAFYLFYPILNIVAFVLMAWKKENAYACFRLLFDIILVMIVATSISWWYIIGPFIVQSNELDVMSVIYAAYPVVDLGLIFSVVKFYTTSQWVARKVLNLFLVGLSILFFADAVYLYLSLNGLYQPGNWVHPLWSAARLIIALAGIAHRESRVVKRNSSEWDIRSNIIQISIPYVLVGVLLLLLSIKLKEINSLQIGLLLCIVMIIIRQVITLLENGGLLRSLERKNRELQETVFTDYLTAMPNRFRFLRDLKFTGNPCVAIINIENFRAINEFYGYEAGDRLLRDFSEHIIRLVKPYRYRAYRLAGDEYAILADSIDDKSFHERVLLIHDLIEQTSFKVHGQVHPLFVTLGIAYTADKPLEKAQMALQYARQHRDRVQIYCDELPIKEKYQSNLYWIQEVQDAIQENRIALYYQPIMDMITGMINKYEVLVRMIDRDGKVILPGCFLPVIKKTKLYPQLTEVVLKKSFTYFSDKNVDFSINLSAADISDKKVRLQIMALLAYNKLGPRVTFEFVESEEFEDPHELSSFINEIKSHDAKIAIDDFGSGYSNFAYILTMGADYIKLDGSLIKEIASNPSVLAIVESIVYFARKLKIKTIAEFVSSEPVFLAAKKIGLDEVQGYFIGEPKPYLLELDKPN